MKTHFKDVRKITEGKIYMTVKNMDQTRDIIKPRATFIIQWCQACSGHSEPENSGALCGTHAILMYLFSP